MSLYDPPTSQEILRVLNRLGRSGWHESWTVTNLRLRRKRGQPLRDERPDKLTTVEYEQYDKITRQWLLRLGDDGFVEEQERQCTKPGKKTEFYYVHKLTSTGQRLYRKEDV